ncbi:MAG TPA: Hsp20/alpha crystallin family protein [Vitreimonas sp.]|nr:Hsp20/alpha crystallin family protein [Vitreimonas sp.]
MTISRRPSPFGELLSLRQAMDRLFEDSYVRPRTPWSGERSDSSPVPLDISTSPDALVIEAALPGVRPDDVEITVEDGTLSIRATTARERQEDEGGYLVQEIHRGEVSRSLTLPTGLEPDKAEAAFDNGVLTLRIPKAEAVKPRQIRINPSTTNGRSDEANAAGADARQA